MIGDAALHTLRGFRASNHWATLARAFGRFGCDFGIAKNIRMDLRAWQGVLLEHLDRRSTVSEEMGSGVPEEPQNRLFISYSRKNKTEVYPFAEALTAAGIEVWIDREEIDP